MTVVVGVDGGGTKTHVLVADESGATLGAALSGPSNWEEIGLEAVASTLRAAVLEALEAAGDEPQDVAASVFGLAGLDWESDHVRLGLIPQALGLGGPSDVVNDAFVALRAGANRPWGVVVVAGSGAVAAGRNPAGETFRTLGLGPTFGDFGSGTDVSQEAVRAVAEAYTGKGAPTALGEAMRAKAGVGSVLELLEGTSRGRFNDTVFAPVVVDAAEHGDRVARGILETAGGALGRSANAVILRLRLEDEEFELVLTGGMFRGTSRIVRSAVEAAVRRVAPKATPVRLEAPPAVGACLLALELAECETNPDLHANLAVGAIEAFDLEPLA